MPAPIGAIKFVCPGCGYNRLNYPLSDAIPVFSCSRCQSRLKMTRANPLESMAARIKFLFKVR